MLAKLLGQKFASMTKIWAPTLAIWGGVGGVALVHFTDWRLVLDCIPYINGKFKNDD